MGEGEGLLFSGTEGEERMGMRGKEKRKKRKSDTLRERREMYKGGEAALLQFW